VVWIECDKETESSIQKIVKVTEKMKKEKKKEISVVVLDRYWIDIGSKL
tara:strand:+ start:362 stop:508 length:147 start_codon:yes stop_codon:yes gene_type:complete